METSEGHIIDTPFGPVTEVPYASIEDIEELAELRQVTLDFNRPRISNKRKSGLIETARILRRILGRKGYSPNYLREIEAGRIGLPLPISGE